MDDTTAVGTEIFAAPTLDLPERTPAPPAPILAALEGGHSAAAPGLEATGVPDVVGALAPQPTAQPIAPAPPTASLVPQTLPVPPTVAAGSAALMAARTSTAVVVAGETALEPVGDGKKKRRPPAPTNDAADLTPEEARAKAAEEGLTLIEANTQTGFLYVYLWNSGGAASKLNKGEGVDAAAAAAAAAQAKIATGKAPRVYQLQPQKGTSMGYYRSAEGAALAYARHIGPEASAIKAKKVQAQPRAQSRASQLLNELGNMSTEARDAMRPNRRSAAT